MVAYYTDSANTVWVSWATSGTASTADTGIWPYWVATTGTATTVTVNTVWGGWVVGDASTVRYKAPPPPTEEQLAAQRAAQQARQEAWEKTERERREAQERATALLLDNLDEQQRAEYQQSKAFTLRVLSEDGERIYRIERGWSGNVKRVDEQGKRLRTYCIHPIDRVPDEDNMLAQKLMLETDEASFLRIANAS